jgi:twitching motility two-component system response regulator PilG
MKQPYRDEGSQRPVQSSYGNAQPHAGHIPPTNLVDRTHVEVQPDLILIIEDSVTVRTVLSVNLSRAGYQCVSFADGLSALRWLHQQAAQVPSLLLLDLSLPGMDGYQVMQQIRTNPCWNSIAVVMLTGRDAVTDRLKGRIAGAQAYLTKPFFIQQLLALVQEMLHPFTEQFMIRH